MQCSKYCTIDIFLYLHFLDYLEVCSLCKYIYVGHYSDIGLCHNDVFRSWTDG